MYVALLTNLTLSLIETSLPFLRDHNFGESFITPIYLSQVTFAQFHNQVLKKPIELKRLLHDKLGKVTAHLANLRHLDTWLQGQLRKTWPGG